jgi:hypothetical protein
MERQFLCGLEFDALASEVEFFVRHSVPLDGIEIEIALSAGELLVFDNFAVAHGRRGIRQPGEVHQWVFGERAVGVTAQRRLRDRVLAAFDGQRSEQPVCDRNAGLPFARGLARATG